MTDISGKLIFDLMKQSNISIDFTEEEYTKLITHFRKSELNQFYMFIIQKVLTKKEFTESSDNIITQLTATLADKVGKTSTPTDTDEQIKSLVDTLYKVLILIDIKEFYNKNF